ncbi:hypothetical protein Tco_0200470 [Tanacetum coccineum]
MVQSLAKSSKARLPCKLLPPRTSGGGLRLRGERRVGGGARAVGERGGEERADGLWGEWHSLGAWVGHQERGYAPGDYPVWILRCSDESWLRGESERRKVYGSCDLHGGEYKMNIGVVICRVMLAMILPQALLIIGFRA